MAGGGYSLARHGSLSKTDTGGPAAEGEAARRRGVAKGEAIVNGPERRRPRRKALRRAIGISVLVLCLGPRVAAGARQAGSIAGTVVASENGQPVPDAVVLVEGESLTAVTNAVGRFELAGAPPGAVALTVQAAGYLELRVPHVQVVAGSATPVTIELVATPNYLERVQVTASKAPLSIGEIAAQADIVDRSTIDERGDQRLTQAIAHVPGVIVSTQAGSFESVMLRGLPRDGNEFTSTLLLIDGVPQTDSRNSARVINLPIHDASSIEPTRHRPCGAGLGRRSAEASEYGALCPLARPQLAPAGRRTHGREIGQPEAEI